MSKFFNIYWNKIGQVTIFIIIALLVVAFVGIYFLVRNVPSSGKIPLEFEEIYDSFSLCVEDVIIGGARILESQGGHIYLPEFEAGSEYMPFSSHLNFLGNPVPYWYYVSGNNLERENIPSINEMENQLGEFINFNIIRCIPENLLDYELSIGNPRTQVSIKKSEIQVNVNMDFYMTKEDKTSSVRTHRFIVNSELGNLYENAVVVYKEEQKNLFLEDYSMDILYSYAPVDGVEFSCMPKVWSADAVFNDLEIAIEENIKTLNAESSSKDYFSINSIRNKISSDVYVRFLNSRAWPKTYEVNPSDGHMLIANPVGMQEGLGILGFCYVPYHFVYDIKYPVMVQIHSKNTDEIFQFPFAVVIENNNPRESLFGTALTSENSGICDNKNTIFEIRTLDEQHNPVNAQIYFECFSDSCFVGTSENGVFRGMVPQCVNSYVVAKADGYRNAEVSITSIYSGSLEIIIDKESTLNVNLRLDSKNYNGEAIIYFTSPGFSKVVSYPSVKSISLSRGEYDISVYAYEDASIALGASTQKYCTEVPRLGGFFGLTKKECYDIQIPESVITRALSGGGKGTISISERNLESADEILINAESLPEPDSLNQIQENYVLYENKNLEIMLR